MRIHRRAVRRGANATFPSRGLHDGEVLELGNVSIDVLHTPGHTPKHISLLVTDRTRSDDPWLVLTGHTLIVGDLGRTELATSAEEGARALFRSGQRLKTLPDYLEVLPGAYSGSVCGRSLSGSPIPRSGLRDVITRHFGSMMRRPSCARCSSMFRQRRRRRPSSAPSIPA
jgi:glyoxylase-like metal-dependent hydrolase (beta-lactamase superfamily II)